MIEFAVELLGGADHVNIIILIRINHLCNPRNADDYIRTWRPVKPFEWRLWRDINLMILYSLDIRPIRVIINIIIEILIRNLKKGTFTELS